MCDRYSAWLKDAAIQNGPILPLEPSCALALLQEGYLGTDSIPTGYKLMQRVLHSEEGSRLGSIEQT
jgi:hypothetical protein